MKKLLIFGLLIVGLGFWLVFQTISSQPLVAKPDNDHIDAAQQVKTLLRKVRYEIRNPPRRFSLRITASELDALGSFANRAIQRVRLQTRLADKHARVAFSMALPSPFEGRYVNAYFDILPSSEGVHIDRVVLGDLQFTSQWSIRQLLRIADVFMDGLLDDILSQITTVVIRQEIVYMIVAPSGPLKQQLNQLASAFGLEDKRQEKQAIRRYYEFLVQLSDRVPKRRNLSLLTYLKPLINEAEAASRSRQTLAGDENRAALLALGYFAGHRHFAGVIGTYAGLHDAEVKVPHQLLLAGRHDLQQHFLYSVMFKLLSDRGVSYMLGELKELMDSGRGGSGFSFADLAADLSGNQFAEYATNAETAILLQNSFASKINERWIFPKIDDLEEGLSRQDFKQSYGEVDSPKYTAIVNEIQKRVEKLRLYQVHSLADTGPSESN